MGQIFGMEKCMLTGCNYVDYIDAPKTEIKLDDVANLN